MSTLASGFPDWQRITQWFGAPLAQEAAHNIGAGAFTVGPLEVRNFASVIVCVKPTGGNVTVTVTQQVPDGPAALQTVEAFTAADGNVLFEAFVLLAGAVSVTFQGTAPGETVAYAIVPTNTNVKATVTALAELGFQHNDALVSNETNADFEDGLRVAFTLTDDPGNGRVKIAADIPQNGAATGSLYRWSGAAWAPTANVIVDDALSKITFAGDTNLYRAGAAILKTDHSLQVAGSIGVQLLGSTSAFIARKANAVNTTVYATRANADTADRYTVDAQGIHRWGDGTLAVDTNLYRAGAGVLFTDSILQSALGIYSRGGGGFNYNPTTATGQALTSQVQGAANALFTASVAGTLQWGAGGGSALDTNLYRAAAATLRTDGDLQVGGGVGVILAGSSSGIIARLAAAAGTYVEASAVAADPNDRFQRTADGTMYWGSGAAAVDASLGRSGAGALKANASLTASGTITALVTGAADGFHYRPTAAGGVLVDSVVVGETFARFYSDGNGAMHWGPGGATPVDTDLYRSAAGTLKTDGVMVSDPQTSVASVTTARAGGAAAALPANPVKYLALRDETGARVYVPAYT